MVAQYPHILFMGPNPTATQSAVTGDWVPGVSVETEKGPCRFEPNGAGRVINLADGQQYVYDYVVYMPLGAPAANAGADVSVKTRSGTVVARGKVKRVEYGQLNTRLWL
jgi:hypothetical protein